MSESAFFVKDLVWQLCYFSGLDSEKTMLLSPYVDAVQKENSTINDALMVTMQSHGWNMESHCFDGPIDLHKLSQDLLIIISLADEVTDNQHKPADDVTDKKHKPTNKRISKLRQALDEIDCQIMNT